MKLRIPKPCSAKFENFEKTARGGFCQQCSTEVIDFSNKTNEEIFDFFLKSKGRVCGRLPAKELSLKTKAPVLPQQKLLAASMSLVSLAISPDGLAQNDVKPILGSVQVGQLSERTDKTNFWSVKGRLLQIGCNETIEGGSVVFNKGVSRTVSNVDGHFELLIPATEQTPTSIDITFKYAGMEPLVKTIYQPQVKMNIGDVHLNCSENASEETILKGRLLDESTQEPVVYANIMLAGSSIGTTSDIDGYFEFAIPIDSIKTARPSLNVSYIGYEHTEIAFSPESSDIALGDIYLRESHGLMGEVIVIGIIEVSRTQRVKSKLKRLFGFGVKRD